MLHGDKVSDINKLETFARRYNVTIGVDAKFDLLEKFEAIVAQYPMLKVVEEISSYYWDRHIEVVANYMNAIDATVKESAPLVEGEVAT